MITDYQDICAICGRPAECTHHLIFGSEKRLLADQDGLTIPMCNRCHNMGMPTTRLHDNIMAEALSKIVGQLAWEKDWIIKNPGMAPEQSRNEFRRRYGKSYL